MVIRADGIKRNHANVANRVEVLSQETYSIEDQEKTVFAK